jgi:hypothetical protein
MISGGLRAAALALLFATSAFAQGGGRAGDPVSGKWGSDGATYLELQYNGEGSVTGTTIWRMGKDHEERAPITKGMFDSETGALKLFGEVKNRSGKVVKYVVDGRVVKEVVSGTYMVGDDKGEFRFTRQ